jgi:hypothetical protein
MKFLRAGVPPEPKSEFYRFKFGLTVYPVEINENVNEESE